MRFQNQSFSDDLPFLILASLFNIVAFFIIAQIAPDEYNKILIFLLLFTALFIINVLNVLKHIFFSVVLRDIYIEKDTIKIFYNIIKKLQIPYINKGSINNIYEYMQYIISSSTTKNQEKQNANRILGFLSGCKYASTLALSEDIFKKSIDRALEQYILDFDSSRKTDKKLRFLAQNLWDESKSIVNVFIAKMTIKNALHRRRTITLKNIFFHILLKNCMNTFFLIVIPFFLIPMLIPVNYSKITLLSYSFTVLFFTYAFFKIKFIALQILYFSFFEKKELVYLFYSMFAELELPHVPHNNIHSAFSYLNHISSSHETTAKDKENANKALGFIEGILSPMASILIRYQTTKAMNMAMKQYLSKIERNRHISDV